MPFELHNQALQGDGLQHVRIACRPNLANGELNGSTGYVVARGEETVRVWLNSGPRAGLCWTFGAEDITAAAAPPVEFARNSASGTMVSRLAEIPARARPGSRT